MDREQPAREVEVGRGLVGRRLLDGHRTQAGHRGGVDGVQLRERPTELGRHAPKLDEHTDEILAELGRDPDTIAALRAEGKTVLLHCWAAQSRTPSAAIAYAVKHLGVPLAQADREVRDALPSTWRNPELLWALEQIGNS